VNVNSERFFSTESRGFANQEPADYLFERTFPPGASPQLTTKTKQIRKVTYMKSISTLQSITKSLLCTVAGVSCLCLSTQVSFAAPQWMTWDVSAGGNGHQYLAVPGSAGLTWDEAFFQASLDSGHLATITSAAENNFIFSLINNSQFFTSLNGSGPAIGGYLPSGAQNGQYAWVTGEAWNYTNWYPTSPDGYTLGQTRLQFWSATGGTPAATWGDIGPSDTNIGGYVVERDMAVPEPGSLALVAVGVMTLMAFKRRQVNCA
jgi:hypothetical protein